MVSEEETLLTNVLRKENINISELRHDVLTDIDFVVDKLYNYIDELKSVRDDVEDITDWIARGDKALDANDLSYRLNKYGELLDELGIEPNDTIEEYRDTLAKYVY